MARRLKLAPTDPGIVVELGKDPVIEFAMHPVTMDIEEKLDECEREMRRIAENLDSKPIDRVTAQVAQLDVLLTPIPTPAGDRDVVGRASTPSEILLPAYQAGEITKMVIDKLVADLIAEARPT